MGLLDTSQVQIEISNRISEIEKRNKDSPITRQNLEILLFECAHKFIVNACFSQ